MSGRVDFSTGNVRANIISMSFPMFLAQLLNVLYSIVDRMYIGRLPEIGENALGGIGICVPIITIITGFSNLFGLGGAPLFAIARGKGDTHKAKTIMHNAFFMLICTAIVLGSLTYIFRKPLLYLLGANDVTYVYASEYLEIYLLGTIFSMISLGMNPYINSQGFARTGMITILVGACTNFILDPIFIYGMNLGVKGAAIATLIAQFLSALWVILFLRGRRPEYRLRIREIVPNGACIKEIVVLGTASFVMSCTDSLVQIVCNKMLLAYGGDIYVSIMSIINSIRQVILTPISAITDGASSVISYNFGANKMDKVKQSIRFMTVLALVYSLVICGITTAFPEWFIRMFNEEGELLDKGSTALRIYFGGFFMMALQYSGQSVFKSLGKARKAIFFSVFRKVILVVPLTLYLPYLCGVTGVYYAEVVSNVVGGGLCFATMMLVIYGRRENKTIGD